MNFCSIEEIKVRRLSFESASGVFLVCVLLTLETLRGGGVNLNPLDFFGFKFLLLDRLSKALAQLFLVCEHIFWH